MPISKVAARVWVSSRSWMNLALNLWPSSVSGASVEGKGSAVMTYFASKKPMGKVWVPGTEKLSGSLPSSGCSGSIQFRRWPGLYSMSSGIMYAVSPSPRWAVSHWVTAWIWLRSFRS